VAAAGRLAAGAINAEADVRRALGCRTVYPARAPEDGNTGCGCVRRWQAKCRIGVGISLEMKELAAEGGSQMIGKITLAATLVASGIAFGQQTQQQPPG